jgi:predicted RNA binding protein YcfA (HicA-like mRNA interferase family)
MKLPRDVSGPELVNALRVLGYVVDRQKGSHVRVTTQRNGEHYEAIRITTRSRPARSRTSSRASPRTTALPGRS